LYLGAFVDELTRSGLRHIVISPGSRSTPIAVLAAEHPELRVWMHVDERSAAFFALGLAKARGEPVALLCTSGTAAANYAPAVAEACVARVPLVVLTADRPHELRDVGAPQTIQQIGLYGDHVKWFMEMPIPEPDDHMLRHARYCASRAVVEAWRKPSGPVHLNFPLREPLLPDLEHPQLFGAGRHDGRAYVEAPGASGQLSRSSLERLAAELAASERGIIICGPIDEPELAAVATELSALLGYPLLADPLSQLRGGMHRRDVIVDAYDAFLRDERAAATLAPDVIIRLGAMPVSKPLLLYLNRHRTSRMLVVDEGGWRDPTLLASDMVFADAGELCSSLTRLLTERGLRRDGEWLRCWQRLNSETRRALDQGIEQIEQAEGMFEGRIFTELRQLLPDSTVLFAGNSMPIRDLDTFYAASERCIRFAGNRGANGIDGLISTALGYSAAGERTVLVLGDLSFYHDMNGLLAAKLHGLPITIIVVNNDGGGIFSFLPQASLKRHYEELFGTPLGLDYAHAAAMYGGTFTRVDSWESFRNAVQRAMDDGGLQLIEVRTDRRSNVEQHRRIWQLMYARLAELKLLGE
jgi:2-succinyl-5-enolpyruvyl-6-hydroxy-3-cyclohexene-1-carboxylate synthase